MYSLSKLLASISVLIGLCSLFFAFIFFAVITPEGYIDTAILFFLTFCVFSTSIYFYTAYDLWRNAHIKTLRSIFPSIFRMSVPLMWFVIAFGLIMWTYNSMHIFFMFHMFAIVFIITAFVSVRRFLSLAWKYYAFVLCLVVVAVFFLNFKENYCYDKGLLAGQRQKIEILTTSEDVEEFAAAHFFAEEGKPLDVRIQASIRCHATFNMKHALLDVINPFRSSLLENPLVH